MHMVKVGNGKEDKVVVVPKVLVPTALKEMHDS